MAKSIPDSVMTALDAYKAKPGDDTLKALNDSITAADAAHDEAAKKLLPPEKYTLTKPNGGYVTDADVQELAERAKKAGLTNDAAQALLNDMDSSMKRQNDRLADQAKARIKGYVDALDKKFPADKKAEIVGKAHIVTGKIGGDFQKILDETGVGNHAEFLEFLASLYDRGALGDDKTTKGGDGSGDKPKTKEQELAAWELDKPIGAASEAPKQ